MTQYNDEYSEEEIMACLNDLIRDGIVEVVWDEREQDYKYKLTKSSVNLATNMRLAVAGRLN